MIKMFKNYINMKKKEIELKLLFYTYLTEFISNRKNIVNSLSSLILLLSNTPIDELKETFINKLAELIHEENNKSVDEPFLK